MPDVLTLRLLGKPQVTLAGKTVTGFISAKAQALLFYLAVTARTPATLIIRKLGPKMSER